MNFHAWCTWTWSRRRWFCSNALFSFFCKNSTANPFCVLCSKIPSTRKENLRSKMCISREQKQWQFLVEKSANLSPVKKHALSFRILIKKKRGRPQAGNSRDNFHVMAMLLYAANNSLFWMAYVQVQFSADRMKSVSSFCKPRHHISFTGGQRRIRDFSYSRSIKFLFRWHSVLANPTKSQTIVF